ncbi:MAG: hypothetical protein KAX49_06020 [Halanaerobiales bacterium]|nr:hypothetical protein [Halanaerobiales bacterium]
MRVKDILDTTLLLLIGVIYYTIFQPIFPVSGLKPDFTLAVLFVIILMKDDFRIITFSILFLSIFASLFTTFSGSWINVIEKVISCGLLYHLVHYLRKYISNQEIMICIISLVGTVLSGCIFCALAEAFVGLPVPFSIFLRKVILPSAFMNLGIAYVLYISFKYSEETLEVSLNKKM